MNNSQSSSHSNSEHSLVKTSPLSQVNTLELSEYSPITFSTIEELPIKIKTQPKSPKKAILSYTLIGLTMTGLCITLGYLGAGLSLSWLTPKILKKKGLNTIIATTILATGVGLQFTPKNTPVFSGSGFIIGSWIAWRKRDRKCSEVLTGTQVTTPTQQQQIFHKQHYQTAKTHRQSSQELRFIIGEQQLPSQLNHLNFFILGSPGSGKTQAFLNLLEQLRRSPDWRVVILDRNGEFMQYLYAENHDLLNNPLDRRSISWSHLSEHISNDSIARALIPNGITDEPIWTVASRAFHRSILERTHNNSQVWQVLTSYSLTELRDLLQGTPAMRYFGDAKTATNVIATYIDRCRFYEYLLNDASDHQSSFSFFDWGAGNDPRWLWMPIFEEQEEIVRSYLTMSMELVIQGLLANEQRALHTAIFIDELAALDEITSLRKILAQGRKFKTTCFLATQAVAQIREVYGEQMPAILLQTSKTKLILNCPDPDSARLMADCMGRQVRLEAPWTNSLSRQVDLLLRQESRFLPTPMADGLVNFAENLEVLFPRHIPSREEWKRIEDFAVPPSLIQHLPSRQGYLLVSDGTPVARVNIPLCLYQPVASVFEAKPSIPS